ncbi:MAG: hypothetical protein WCI22_00640 [Actinomycetota bacterium]
MTKGCGLAERREVLDRVARFDVGSVDVSSFDADELRALVGEVQLQRSRLALAAGDVLHAWDERGVWRARLLQVLPHTRAAVAPGPP